MLAFSGYALTGEFGAASSTPANPEPLSSPAGVAVSQATEDVYVVDRGNDRVEQFSSTGTYLSQFNGSVGPPTGSFSAPEAIAVDNSGNGLDPSNGDVYVQDTGNDVIDKFSAAGSYEGQLTGTCASPGTCPGEAIPFRELHGVAIDPEGNLWVYEGESEEKGKVDEFSGAGSFVKTFNTERGAEPGIAVDSSDNVYVVLGDLAVGKFDSTSGAELAEFSEEVPALAIDPATNNLFVDQASHVSEYGPFGEPYSSPIATFPSGGLSDFHGIAVNANTGTVYATQREANDVEIFNEVVLPDVVTGAATNLTEGSATLNGTVNPDGVPVSVCQFEYGTSSSYGHTVACEPNPGAGTSAVPVSAEVKDLRGGVRYHFRLDAANANGIPVHGADETFTIPSPIIEATSTSNLTETSVDLNAKIDPDGLKTTYRFEYGTTTAYGTTVPAPPLPEPDIGEGTEGVVVTQHVSGLFPNITYHWRVVAHNAAGTATGADHTFVYFIGAGTSESCPNEQFRTGASANLPDCRAYEMATPADKAGSVVSPTSFTIAADGSSLAGESSGAFAGLSNDELPSQGAASYRFGRTGSGWVTTPLQVFQGWLQSLGVSDSVWRPASGFGVQYLSLRQADGSVSDVGPVWPPTFGSVSASSYHVEGAASEASHGIVFISEEPTPKWPFDATVAGGSLYEYVGTNNSEPTLVGVSGGAGSTALIGQCGSRLGASNNVHFGSKYNAISESGQTVFFTGEADSNSLSSAPTSAWASTSTCTHGGATGTAPPTNELYARQGGSQTVWVSQPQCTPTSACHNVTTEPYPTKEGSEAAGVIFEGASADGSKVFFTTTQQLTNSDTDTTRDLYEYDFNAPAGQRLTQVSAGGSGDATPGSGAEGEGVSRISEDGSHVYFVAQGVLTTNPSPGAQGYGAHGEPVSAGAVAQAAAENLYAFDTETKQTAFIAELCSGPEASGSAVDAYCPSSLNSNPWNFGASHNDQILWSHGTTGGDARPVQSTPDGGSLVFTSYGNLTADDTSTARQVFHYDAQAGRLTRVSVGEAGFNDNGNTNAGNESLHVPDTGNASIVTPVYEGGRGGALARTASDDGSYVFFESPVALTPQALEDVPIDSEGDLAQNIYEYHDGHVALISDGKDTSAVYRASGNRQMSSVFLAGASASGSDVFFTTADPLVPQDTDTQVDIYDARIGGGFRRPVSPAGCQGDTCQGLPGTPPLFGAPSSATFSGAGNLAPPLSSPATKPKAKPLTRAQKLAKARRACRAKHNKRKRAVCEAKARKQYGPAHKANKTNRRGK